jgi:hypothetical protein
LLRAAGIRFASTDLNHYSIPLLYASALEAQGSVQLLGALVRSPDKVPALDEFILTRRKDKRITEAITEEPCKTFVTPLEREDIEALSFALYKGFHDTAISIAASVSTQVLTPRQAVAMAALFNLFGALVGTSVAATIGKGWWIPPV